MKKKVHYRQIHSIYTECGFFAITSLGDKATSHRKQVTCKTCKRTKLFRKIK